MYMYVTSQCNVLQIFSEVVSNAQARYKSKVLQAGLDNGSPYSIMV